MKIHNMESRVVLLVLSLGLFSLLAPVAQASLIFHQDLDDATGLTSSGSGQSFVPGVLGDALSLDGNGFYETTATFAAMGDTNRTVSIWVKLNGTTTDDWWSIMQFGLDSNSASGGNWAMQVDGATEATSIDFGKSVGTGAANDITGSWQLITYTLDGTTTGDTALYINGSISTYSVKSDRSFTTKATPIKFGNTTLVSGDTMSDWNGLLDDVSIWNAAFTADEILSLYDVGDRLAYDAGKFDSMKIVHDAGSGSVMIDTHQWDYASGLTGDAGLNIAGDILVMDATNDTGLVLANAPEPATMSLLAIGGVAILKRRKK